MKAQYPNARNISRALLLAGACFLSLIRLAGADDAYGVPVGPPPPDIPPVTTPKTNVSSNPTANASNSNGPAQQVTDVQSKMADLESKYKNETTEAIELVKDRYVENLKQLMQSEIDKGDPGAAAAIKKKLDNVGALASPAPKPPAIATTPKPATQGSRSPVTNSPEPYALKQLRLKFESESRGATEPEALSAVQSRYYDLFKQLLQKEILKGDESAALAVKLEMVKTQPGYPFTRRWAAHGDGGGFSLILFKPGGDWSEDTNGNFTNGQWHTDDDKTAVVNFPNNSPWQFKLNEEGHLIRNDGLDYKPDDQIRAYVPQAADGSLTLGPDDADISGTHLQKGLHIPPALGGWSDSTDSVTWQVKVRKSGTYHVVFNYSLNPDCQGTVVVLSAGPEQLNFTPASTGDWNTYQEKDAGQITLKTGPVEIELTAEDKPGSAVMNLQSITLVPEDPAATGLVAPKPL